MKLTSLFLITISLLTLSCGKENSTGESVVPIVTPQDIENLNIQVENDKAVITGTTISIDQYDLQGLKKKLHNKSNFKEVIFNCDTFVIQTLLNMPSTDLTIKAKTFKSYQGAQINLTPLPYKGPAEKFQNGKRGENGKTLKLDIKEIDLHEQIDRPLFIVNGGNGQNAGAGENGKDGISVDHRDGVIASYKLVRGELVLAHGTYYTPTAGNDPVKGGLPGEAGKGGIIKTNIVLEPQHYRIEGGLPGNPHATVYSGNPGSPNPFIIINERNKREVNYLKETTSEHGAPAKKARGEYGDLIYLDE